MKLNELKPSPGSRHRRKRVGRGIGSGHGKTCCRGHKGQKARSGGDIRPGFEGGQTPLYRRIPKRGFSSAVKNDFVVINISDLKDFGGEITLQHFVDAGFIRNNSEKVKILGDGSIEKAVNIQAHAFSKSAKDKIEKAGGKAVII